MAISNRYTRGRVRPVTGRGIAAQQAKTVQPRTLTAQPYVPTQATRTNPNVSIGFGPAPIQEPQLEAMPYTGPAAGLGSPYQARPDLGPNVGFGVGMPAPEPTLQPQPMGGKGIGSSMANAINTQIGQSQDPNVQQFAPLTNAVGQFAGNTVVPILGGLFNQAQQQPGPLGQTVQQLNTAASQAAPMGGKSQGSNLPGNF